MLEISGFITAGGRSSRMGRDKAWLEINGLPLIKHVIAAMSPLTSELAIIANDERYLDLGLPVFSDSKPDIGPLEAVRVALTNCHASHALLLGCDLPFVTAELLAFLIQFVSNNQAVVPKDPKGTLEPLCAIYCKDLLPTTTQLIESGERKVRVLFESATTRIVEFEEIRHLQHSRFFFDNINTSKDYQRAVLNAQRLNVLNAGGSILESTS